MADWRNRIVGYDVVEADQLLANPSNWRVHPKAQQDALTGVLDDVGWVQEIIVNKVTGHVVDGHMRVEVAITRGESVPVKYVELSEDEEKLILATIDPISAMAATDAAQLEALLADVNSDSAAVQTMLAQLAEDSGLFLDNGEPTPDAGAQIDRASDLAAQYGTAVGQVWQLGNHRLACIDSTDEKQVKEFIGNTQVKMVFADPPYGVEVVQDNKVGAVFKESVATKGHYVPIVGDSTTATAIDAYNLFSRMAKMQIWWGANYYANCLPPSSCWIVWDKRAGTEIQNTFADCELAWTSHTGATRIYRQLWNGMIREGEHEKRVHPTQKPVGLAAWCFEEFTKPNDIIVDPFAGSGISIIAGEQTGRTVYAIELSPEYVAVILQRWSDMTGLQPKLSE